MNETPSVETSQPAASRRVAPQWPLLIALAALGLSGWQFYQSGLMQADTEQVLAKRLASTEQQLKASQQQAAQALALVKESNARYGEIEARVNATAGQYATLNTLYQSLTQNRADWLLAEVEHTLAVAQQQLQLAGNVRATIAALEGLDTRLAQYDQPQLIGLKRALGRDLETLKALPYLDSVGLTVKIDRLLLGVDQLPLVVDHQRLTTHADVVVNRPLPPASAPWWERLSADISNSFGELVRIRRMDKPEALLLSPEQGFFLRENLKLRLLDARLALTQRDAHAWKTDIAAARGYVQRYFASDAPATQRWQTTLAELEQAPLDVELPDLAASLKAAQDARASGVGQ